MAALVVLLGCESLQNAVADGETRTISLHHLHTDEDITITYKRNGRYEPDALKKLDWFLRDWRRNESTHMDPRLIDIVWRVSREVGAEKPIQVVCGYRSPATNTMLRRRSKGVAQFSQHMRGHALDFYIPGVPLEELRVVGLRLQRGGVGYYPTSGSPFVHLDTGSIRHWPRMTREQLARVFPNGRTVHIPSDGKPLPGYELALADVEKRGDSPSEMSLEAARNAGISDAAKPARSLLAGLFGAKDDEDADEVTGASDARSVTPAARVASAAADAKPQAPRSATTVAAVPVLTAVPTPPIRPARPTQVANAATASASADNLFLARGTWDEASSGLKQITPDDLQPRFRSAALASVDVNRLGAGGAAPQDRATEKVTLAYTAATVDAPAAAAPPAAARVAAIVPAISPAQLAAAAGAAASSLRSKTKFTRTANAAERTAPVPVASFDDVWLRAMVLAPDLQYFMSVVTLGAPDTKELRALMRKPSSAVAMTFTDDPMLGIVADHFSGDAVVFPSTVNFVTRISLLQR